MTAVEEELAKARERLLDLTLRNRLLNFRPFPARTIRVEGEIPREVYDLLVLRERVMGFRARGAPGTMAGPEGGTELRIADCGLRIAPGEAEIGPSAVPVPVPVPVPDPQSKIENPKSKIGPPPDAQSAIPDPQRAAEPPPNPLLGKEGGTELQNADFGLRIGTREAEIGPSAVPVPVPNPKSEIRNPKSPETDSWLDAALDKETLEKRLYVVYQKARTVVEEQGYTLLHLALGFLEWFDAAEPTVPRRAPLILVPVELSRIRLGRVFKLRWTGEDLLTNLSLKAKLAEFGLDLPDFEPPEEKGGIDAYLGAVAAAVAAKPGWRVVPEVALDFFSFTKFVMYKDLDPAAWPEGRTPAERPLLASILAPADGPAPAPGFSEDEVDKRVSARSAFHVLDADPSQVAVLEDAKAGRSLVVEGPPGTGKSQTITNLIAELLGAGKTVLFVSEKMAALEVVKARLDGVGLGDFCAELHSRGANKKRFLEELERTLASPPPGGTVREEEYDRLERLRMELNGYASALREPWGPLGRTVYELYGMRESARSHFDGRGRELPWVPLPQAMGTDEKGLASALHAVSALSSALPRVRPVAANPWRETDPPVLLPGDEAETAAAIDTCRAAAEEARAAAQRLAEAAGTRTARGPGETPAGLAAARLVAQSLPIERPVLLHAEWTRTPDRAEALLRRVEAHAKERALAASRFHEKAFERDAAILAAEYRDRAFRLLRVLSGRYRFLKRDIAALYKAASPENREGIAADLDHLAEVQRMREALRGAAAEGKDLFGSHWRGDLSDPPRLRSLLEWLLAFRRALGEGLVEERALDLVAHGVVRETLERLAREAEDAGGEFTAARERLGARLSARFDEALGGPQGEAPWESWAALLSRWRGALSALLPWSQFCEARRSARATAAAPLAEACGPLGLEPEDLRPCLQGNFADELLHAAFAARPDLAGFAADLQEGRIRDFRAADRAVLASNRERLLSRLHGGRPSLWAGASPGSEAGILLGELNRKRGHKPIRKLLSLAGGLIRRIKPCFMMSPLSIAQFLDPRTTPFDVVVFDEASQVRPEDALGALLRGAQAVVMGDTRQLPPTRFFDHLVEGDDEGGEDEAAAATDVESILHQCRRSFPTKTLRWHYRSRHESLIAVSNREFYGDRLLLYPSPADRSPELGLSLVHLPGTVYDRGKASVNREEARAVARAAVELARRSPGKTLGIGTFNIRQQEAIIEAVDEEILRNPDLEPFFAPDRNEPFFVKNLETIQGDERDVIFLSIGFGFDDAGKLSLNFGPLNQEGGERRLNVLITRARERCVAFSNFRASDLRLSEGAAFGLRALRVFLEFAERRDLRSPSGEEGEPQGPFEGAVAGALSRRGFSLRRRVGCAGFRVDLAVTDPKDPSRCAAGIELDGPKYHASKVARDRDRLRLEVLERLGWRIARAWSTDWYRARPEAERRLVEEVEKAMGQDFGSRISDFGSGGGAGKAAHVGGLQSENRNPKSAVIGMASGAVPPPGPLPGKEGGPDAEGEKGGAQNAKDEGKPKSEIRNPPADPVAPKSEIEDPESRVRSPDAEIRNPKSEIPPYAAASSLGIPIGGDISEMGLGSLARAVVEVVDVEGPVAFEEVVRRVRTLWGLKRAGPRAWEALDAAARFAERGGRIRRQGDFLWPAGEGPAPVRRRTGDPPARIELICDEELAAALGAALAAQHATFPDDLCVQASRLLGFPAATAAVCARFRAVLDAAVASGGLRSLPNGMIDLKPDCAEAMNEPLPSPPLASPIQGPPIAPPEAWRPDR